MSRDGGAEPAWSRNGRELYYMQGDQLYVVGVNLGEDLAPAVPRLLFANKIFAYDAAPDGRFLVVEDRADQSASSPMAIMVNWLAGLDAKLHPPQR